MSVKFLKRKKFLFPGCGGRFQHEIELKRLQCYMKLILSLTRIQDCQMKGQGFQKLTFTEIMDNASYECIYIDYKMVVLNDLQLIMMNVSASSQVS